MGAIIDKDGVGISTHFVGNSVGHAHGDAPLDGAVVYADSGHRAAAGLHQNQIVEYLDTKEAVAWPIRGYVSAPSHFQIHPIQRLGRRRARTRMELGPMLSPNWGSRYQKCQCEGREFLHVPLSFEKCDCRMGLINNPLSSTVNVSRRRLASYFRTRTSTKFPPDSKIKS